MKEFLLVVLMAALWSCGGGGASDDNTDSSNNTPTPPVANNDGRGVGEIKNVTLNNPLDAEMVKRGNAIYDMKCSACHKLTAQRVVGPGFAGVTERRKPEWIMNMVTNTEAMLEKDPAAQALLEECLTRMPNQNVSQTEARDILEFFLSNDQAK
jgi:cytochrome c2